MIDDASGFVHIRIQKSKGGGLVTTIQGLAPKHDLDKIVHHMKKVINDSHLHW